MLKENEQKIGNVIEEVRACLIQSGVESMVFKIDESGNLPECLSISQLDLILSELTDNCKDCGAKEITVAIEENAIQIEDDVRHLNPQAIVEKLNRIRGSKMKDDPKKWQEIVFGKVGGIGVSEIVLGILKNTGGSLSYSVVDGDRIAAKISWTTAS